MAAVDPRDLEAPSGSTKRWILGFVAAFLVVQILLPISYYLRDDPYDERFAWRMFSPIRQHACRSVAREKPIGAADFEPIRLDEAIHVGWARMLGRNRTRLVHAFLRQRCERGSVSEVELLNHCTPTTGQELAPLRYALDCKTGELTTPASYLLPRERP